MKDNQISKVLEIPLMDMTPFVRRASKHYIEGGLNTGVRIIPHYQLHYVIKGCGTFTINGTTYKAKKGDFFFWGPGERHIITSDVDNPMRVIGVQFDLTQNYRTEVYQCLHWDEANFTLAAINEIIVFEEGTKIPSYSPLDAWEKMEYYLDDLVKVYGINGLYCPERTSSLLKSVLLLVLHNEAYGRISHDNKVNPIHEVVAYLNQNYQQSMTNQFLGDRFKYHANYLNHMVTEYTGQTIQQYLIHIRMNKAIDLLLNTNMTIGEVGEAVGGYNIHYFSRLFRKKIGLSPSAFRR